jgi:hypothetical protein
MAYRALSLPVAFSPQRRGTGLLIAAVTMAVLTLSVIGFARRSLTSNQMNDCRSLVARRTAYALARSVLAEMLSRLRTGLADPANAVRARLLEPAAGATDTDLTDQVAPRDATLLLDADPYRGCRIETAECRIVSRAPLGDGGEQEGSIRFRVKVRPPAAERAPTQAITETYGFKVVLAAPPRPFGAYGLFSTNAAKLTDVSGVAAARENLVAALNTCRQHAARIAEGPDGDEKERALDLLDDFPDEKGAREGTTLPVVASDTYLYGLTDAGAKLNLANLDLTARVGSATQRARSEMAGGEATPVKSLQRAADAIKSGIYAMWGYLEVFQLLPPDAPAGRPELDRFISQIDEVRFAQRAQYRIAVDGDPTEAFTALLRRYHNPGTVHVTAAQPLVLRGRTPAPLMVTVNGGGVNISDLPGDSTGRGPTIACFGGTVKVTGQAHAFLIVAKGATVEIAKGSVLTGGLVMLDVGARCRLDGTLIRDVRYDVDFDDADPSSWSRSSMVSVGLAPYASERLKEHW